MRGVDIDDNCVGVDVAVAANSLFSGLGLGADTSDALLGASTDILSLTETRGWLAAVETLGFGSGCCIS